MSLSAAPATTKGHRTREVILQAARKVFGRDGYVQARMSDIAAKASISTGGLYRYFSSKEDVFEAEIANVHEALFAASGHTMHDFGTAPYEALYKANLGYFSTYYAHRDLMCCFREAAGVERRFRSFWWRMRKRHVDRFARAMHRHYGVDKIDGADLKIVADAMACMVEECAYVWYAHHSLNDRRIEAAEAASIVTRIWHQTFFRPGAHPEAQSKGLHDIGPAASGHRHIKTNLNSPDRAKRSRRRNGK